MAAVRPMWSIMKVSCGWRSAMRANIDTRPGAKNMTSTPAFSTASQNQSVMPSVSQGIIVGLLNVTRTPNIPSCSFHFGSSAADCGFWSRDAAHDGEAVGISLGRLHDVVVAVARPAWRNDDGAIDAGLVHHRHKLLDGERFRELGLSAGHPWPVRRFRFPQMDLRIDDRSPAYGLRGHLLAS